MRFIYTSILPIILLLISVSACQKDNSEELKTLNSFLYQNYQINTTVLKYQQEEYHIKAMEKPTTRIKKLDTINETYTKLISKISNAIVAENSEVNSLKKEYNQLLDEIGQFVKTEQDYTINRFLTNNKNLQLDSKYHLNVLRNNLVIAMSYVYDYSKKNLSIQDNIKSLKHVDTRVDHYNKRTIVTLSSAIAQTSNKNRYIVIDRITLNDSETKLNYTVHENTAFADITFDSLQPGIYKVLGKLQFPEEEKIIDLPFSRKFEVK